MKRKNPGTTKTILIWVIANGLGVTAIGLFLFLLPLLKSFPGMLVSTLGIGLPLGLAQWIALRRVAPVSFLWILTVPVGLFLGLKALPLVSGIWGFADDESALSLTAGFMIIGLVVGLIQWVFLWRRFARSLLWLLGSPLGLGLGIYLVIITDLINQFGLGAIILVVLVYGLITGLVISWIHALPESPPGELVNPT